MILGSRFSQQCIIVPTEFLSLPSPTLELPTLELTTGLARLWAHSAKMCMRVDCALALNCWISSALYDQEIPGTSAMYSLLKLFMLQMSCVWMATEVWNSRGIHVHESNVCMNVSSLTLQQQLTWWKPALLTEPLFTPWTEPHRTMFLVCPAKLLATPPRAI